MKVKKWFNVEIVTIRLISILLYLGGLPKKISLSKNKEFARATITDFSTIKTSHYLEYTFQLDTVKYKGSGHYYPRKDSFVIGDTIVIVYDKTNPKNNRPWRDL